MSMVVILNYVVLFISSWCIPPPSFCSFFNGSCSSSSMNFAFYASERFANLASSVLTGLMIKRCFVRGTLDLGHINAAAVLAASQFQAWLLSVLSQAQYWIGRTHGSSLVNAMHNEKNNGNVLLETSCLRALKIGGFLKSDHFVKKGADSRASTRHMWAHK